jgi:hypothetical protein
MRRWPTEIIASPPPGRSRTIASIFIVSYLVWQFALPVSYYLSDDDSDERFAWRMFSSLSYFQKGCEVVVSEWARGNGTRMGVNSPQKLDLQQSWSELLAKNRSAVVTKYLQLRCRASPLSSAVQFVQICPVPGGARAPYEEIWLNCRTGVLRRRGY